jgi:hypothetical protein
MHAGALQSQHPPSSALPCTQSEKLFLCEKLFQCTSVRWSVFTAHLTSCSVGPHAGSVGEGLPEGTETVFTGSSRMFRNVRRGSSSGTFLRRALPAQQVMLCSGAGERPALTTPKALEAHQVRRQAAPGRAQPSHVSSVSMHPVTDCSSIVACVVVLASQAGRARSAPWAASRTPLGLHGCHSVLAFSLLMPSEPGRSDSCLECRPRPDNRLHSA